MRWTEFDRPILQAIYELEAEGRGTIDGPRITEVTGINEPELTRSVAYLYHAGYIEAADASGGAREEYIVRRITPAGLEKIGQWPSPEAVAVVLPDMIRDLAAQRVDPEERNLLERVVENVSSGMLTAVATRYFPGI